MIEIPFTKLHGAENDFLLSWAEEVPSENLPHCPPHLRAHHWHRS